MHRIHRTSCRERTPTDGTDEHRCRRVWHPCHTHAAKFCGFREFCGNKAHPKHLCKSVKSVGEKIFPQNARNAQKLLAEKSLPQMSTELTEPLAEKNLPQMAQMRTDVGGYGIPAIPTLPIQLVQLSPLGFAACQSKNCTNKTKGTYCSVGTLLARLVHLRQVHPLEGTLTSVQICEIRGRKRHSHRTHGTHRNFWQRKDSHRWHRCSQM